MGGTLVLCRNRIGLERRVLINTRLIEVADAGSLIQGLSQQFLDQEVTVEAVAGTPVRPHPSKAGS